MLGKLRNHKIKSATIIETIIAMLILMISFSAGMVIYKKVINVGVNDLSMRADWEAEMIMDSLSKRDNRIDLLLPRSGLMYEIRYKKDERYPALTVMNVVCRDSAKRELSKNVRLIEFEEHEQN